MLKISLQMQYNINTCELSQINCVKTDMLFCFGFFFWSTISPNCAQVKCLHTKQLMLQCTCDDILSMFRAEKQTLVFSLQGSLLPSWHPSSTTLLRQLKVELVTRPEEELKFRVWRWSHTDGLSDGEANSQLDTTSRHIHM